MNQKRDYNSLKLKEKISSFGIGLLSMVICLGTQLAMANSETSLSMIELANSVQSTVTGTVTDADGQPLPGANVLVKGTTTGTQTDFDGNFTIEAAGDATLIFSYIGFSSKEVAVDGQSAINVSMAEDASQLEEVVVLGYSTQTRGELTGSVASVDLVEATKAPIVNAAEALQGRVSGVTVIQSGDPGAPPKINIRGFGTSNNTNPLYIIDGLQTDDPFVLNSINPNDIDQMNVLKDGAAAIYGARAANGVVIITTKGGGYNMEKPIVSIDTYTGFSGASNLPGLLSAQQLGDALFQGAANDGTVFDHPQYGNGSSAVVPSTLQGYTRIASYNPQVSVPVSATIAPGGTDWLDAIFRSALIQSASLSVANGEENSKYALSVNYLNKQGVLLNTEYKQGTIRLNSEFKLGDKVRIGQHLSTAYSNGHGGGGGQVAGAVRSSPLIPVYDDEGNLAGTSLGSGGTGNARSPVAQLVRGDNDFNKTLRVLGDVYLSAEILNGLTFKTTIGGTINSFDARRFLSLDPEHGEPLSTNTLTETTQSGYEWTFTNTLNYKKTFDDHKVDVLLGIEANKQGGKGNQIARNGYFNETPDYYLLQNGDPSGTPNVNFSFDGASSLYSLFGSATYSFADKYFLTGTLRNDTSSRFSAASKSDVFPSISAGWVVSKENFLADSDGIVSWLKLKGSWGQLGNQTLPIGNPNINISGLSPNTGNYAIDGSTISTGAILAQVGNDILKWETSVATNAGFELGLFDNKLNFDFEWYNIDTEDVILQNFNRISSTAIDAAAPFENFGNVNNTGFDINLRFKEELDSSLKYGFNLNFSQYKNEVTALISDFLVPNSGLRGGDVTRTEVGGPISAFYGREVTGFDADGRFTFLETGDDGTNRKVIGSPHPDFTYGMNLNVGYKGWDASAFLQGSEGNDIYNYTKIFTDFPTFVNGNRSVRVLDSWTPSNTNATLPAITNSLVPAETEPNSYFVEDGSYLRLKNLQIGYALPEAVVEKIGFDSFRVYVQGTNLLTFTGYDGLDPEIISNDNLNLGVDTGAVPLAKIYTLGLNIKL